MILTIKTDQPQAEIRLFDNENVIAEEVWEGHRQLSATILTKITQLLEDQSKTLQSLSGVVVFLGPGSFTGLRIGITVANTLSYGLGVPVVGTQGEEWQISGIKKITNGENEKIVKPIYGGEANITQPRK